MTIRSLALSYTRSTLISFLSGWNFSLISSDRVIVCQAVIINLDYWALLSTLATNSSPYPRKQTEVTYPLCSCIWIFLLFLRSQRIMEHPAPTKITPFLEWMLSTLLGMQEISRIFAGSFESEVIYCFEFKINII